MDGEEDPEEEVGEGARAEGHGLVGQIIDETMAVLEEEEVVVVDSAIQEVQAEAAVVAVAEVAVAAAATGTGTIEMDQAVRVMEAGIQIRSPLLLLFSF